MKKFITSILIVASSAVLFYSCSKEENPIEAQPETQTITFNAVSPATRTTFGTLSEGKYPTIWSGNESEVKIAQNYSNGIEASVTKKSDTEATFGATFTDDESGSYTFYAVSPASAVVSGVNSNYMSWNLEIPREQTPTATGPDEKAMLMVATSSTEAAFPSTVDLNFTHLTAYAKMSITNLSLDDGDAISTVLVTASNNISYRYYYYVGGDNAGTMVASSAQNDITIHTSSTSDIWFACAPLQAGTTLTVAVTTTNSKVYTKENLAIPAALAAGHIAVFNVNFSGITASEDLVYNLVTSYDELTAGSKVILAAVGSTAYAAGVGTTSSNFISAVAQVKSDDYSIITNPATTVDVFEIEAGTVNNTIALKGTNGYLYAKSNSSNHMGIQTTNDENSSWTPTITDSSTGEMTLVAESSENRNHMHYNSDRFSCYSSTSSVTSLQALYKLKGSGSGSSLITTYTITYDGNGNTSGSAPTASVTTGISTVADPGDLAKTDYVFDGWNTAADGSGTSYAVGDAITVTANTTLYAKWKEDTGETAVSFIAGTDLGSTTGTEKDSITKNIVTISSTSAAFGRTDNYRIYGNSTTTISISDNTKKIIKVEFTPVGEYANTLLSVPEGGVGAYANGVWTGESSSLTLKASAQYRASKIIVTYK